MCLMEPVSITDLQLQPLLSAGWPGRNAGNSRDHGERDDDVLIWIT